MENEKVLWEMSAGAPAVAARIAPGRFEKELLRVGRWTHPARKFVLEVTRERLARWAESFKRMVKKGIRIPVPYGHSYDPRDNAGFVTGMRVEGDSLVGVLEIPRPEDAARMGSLVTDVSVSVNPAFSDGEGEAFGEVVEHVAITNYPVVPGQANFVALENESGASVVRLVMEAEAGKDDEPSDGEETALVEGEGGDEAQADAADETKEPTDLALTLERREARIRELEGERIDREVESLLLAGRISPAVEGHVRRILSAQDARIYLSATGETVSPADEMRAILSALPRGAWVPLEDKPQATATLARREDSVSDERARRLAMENAAFVAGGR